MSPLRAAAAVLLLAATAGAQEISAVIGADQPGHREVLDSCRAALGSPVAEVRPGEDLPAGTKVALVFGGKAAARRYPRVSVVYAMAPGTAVSGRGAVKIMMEADADALLSSLSALQPGLKRLAVLWTSAPRAKAVERLAARGAARGIEVLADRLGSPEDLPMRLRSLKGKADAIWLPPDPLLINARTFETIKRFSYDNDLPFYVPTAALAEHGATAAVSVSNAEMGRGMAAESKALLAGEERPSEWYGGKVQVVVNRSAAAEAELVPPVAALKTADKVLP